MHRELVLKVLDEYSELFVKNTGTEFVLNAILSRLRPWKSIDFIGYLWRVHPDGNHVLTRENAKLYEAINKAYKIKKLLNFHFTQ